MRASLPDLRTNCKRSNEDRETYLVPPDIAREVPNEVIAFQLYTAINRQGVVFPWPTKLPNPDGRQLESHRSAIEAAEFAMRRGYASAPTWSLARMKCL